MTSTRLRVAHVLPDLAVAGGPRYVVNLVSASTATDVEHHLVALQGGPMYDALSEVCASVDVLGPAGRLQLPRRAWELASILRRRHIDIVHTNGTPADRMVGQGAAALRRVPVVNTIHGVPLADLPLPRGWRGPLIRVRRGLRTAVNLGLIRTNVDAHLANSRLVARTHARALHLPVEAFTIVSPGLPPEALARPGPQERTRVRAELGVEGSRVLVNVGRFDPAKGQDTTVKVVAELVSSHPDVVLLLVGDGVCRGDVEALARRIGVGEQVRFLGMRSDVPALLRAADVYVTASVNEGFGIAPLEAMAMELPVVGVTGEINAIDEFIEDGCTGLLVGGDDPAAVAAAVASVLDDPVLARRLGRAAGESARQRTAAATTARVEQVYRSVAARRRCGVPASSAARSAP